MDILAKVKAIVADRIEMDVADINPAASFNEDLGVDSLEIVNLIMAFEDEFEIEIPDEDVEKRIVTIQDAVDYLTERTS